MDATFAQKLAYQKGMSDMGFSLQAFFEECIQILDSNTMWWIKYRRLAAHIRWGVKYAAECGQINQIEGEKQ